MHFLNEIAEHLLGNFKIRNYAFGKRPHCGYMPGRAADHFFGFSPDLNNLPGFFIHRHHRGLVDHDPAAANINQRIGRAQVNADVFGE